MAGASDGGASDDGRVVVEVTMTEQQAVIFDLLRREAQFDTSDGEIVRRVFQKFVRQEG
jgi:hypothetical protein